MKRLSLFCFLVAFVLQAGMAAAQSCPNTGLTVNLSGSVWPFPALGLSPTTPMDQHVVIPTGQSLSLTGVDLYFANGAEIRVETGGSLSLLNCRLFSCDENETWGGIKAQSGATVDLNSTKIFNAEVAVEAVGMLTFSANDCGFRNFAEAGVRLTGFPGSPAQNTLLDGCEFVFNKPSGLAAFSSVPVMLELLDWNGIILNDCEFIQSSGPTLDPSPNDRCTGVKSANSDVEVTACLFKWLGQGMDLSWSPGTFGPPPTGVSALIGDNQFLNCLEGLNLSHSHSVEISDNLFGLNANRSQTVDPLSTQVPLFIGFRSEGNVSFLLQRNRFVKLDENPGLSPASYTALWSVADGDLHTGAGSIVDNEFKFRLPDNGSYPGVENTALYLQGHGQLGPPGFYPDPYFIHCNYFNLDDNSTQAQSGIEIVGIYNGGLGEAQWGIYNAFTPAATSAPGMRHIDCFIGGVDYFDIGGPLSPDPVICSGVSFSSVSQGAVCAYASKRSSEPHEIQTFEAFPNPVFGQNLNVRLSKVEGELQLINFAGQIVYKRSIQEREEVIPVHSFAAGMYVLIWNTADGREIQKINIQP